ncbi:hypothetical protein [Methanopyrus kandleri]
MLGAVLAVVLALPGPALADCWTSVPGVHLGEWTELTVTGSTVQAHLIVGIRGYGLEGNFEVPIKVLVPSDAELVTAKWKPKEGGEVEVEPVSVRTVTWPGDTDQIGYLLRYRSEDPLGALFPDGVIRWRELTFVVPVEAKGSESSRCLFDVFKGEYLGTLDVTVTARLHRGKGEEGEAWFFAWPIPASPNPGYDVKVHGLYVDFVTVYDPETGRWRWFIPVIPLEDRSSAYVYVKVDVAGPVFTFGVKTDHVSVGTVYPWDERASQFLSLTQYLPVLVVMKKELQRGEANGETASPGRGGGGTGSTRTGRTVPLIVPIVPVRRR